MKLISYFEYKKIDTISSSTEVKHQKPSNQQCKYADWIFLSAKSLKLDSKIQL